MSMSVSKTTVMVIKSNTFQQRNLENNHLETNIKKTTILVQHPASPACSASQSQQTSQPASQPESQPASKPTSKLQASKPAASKPAAVKGGRRQWAKPLRSAAPRSEVAGRARYEDKVLCIAARRSLPPLRWAPPLPSTCRQPSQTTRKKAPKNDLQIQTAFFYIFCVFGCLWGPRRGHYWSIF